MNPSPRPGKDVDDLVRDAIAKLNVGKRAEAEKILRRALKKSPDDANANNVLGVMLLNGGRAKEACRHLGRLAQLQPTNAPVINNLGVAQALAGDPAAGIASLRRATQVEPGRANFWVDLGKVLADHEQNDDALDAYRKALAIDPKHVNALNNAGDLLREGLDFEEAEKLLRQASALAPARADVLNNLALVLHDRGDFEAALPIAREATRLAPASVPFAINVAMILRQLGRRGEVLETLERVLALNPDDVDAHFTLAINLLTLGRIGEAWPHFAYHWQKFSRNGKVVPLRGPKWDGKAIPHGTLLVRSDHGPGDEIMFSTCIPEAVDALGGGHLVLECDSRLVPLFRRTFPNITVMGRLTPGEHAAGNTYPKFTAELPAAMLPSFFRHRFEDFARAERPTYLADPDLAQMWRARFDALGDGAKIGIAWRGGHASASRVKRSIPIETLLPILAVPGCVFINLQYGKRTEELNELADRHGIVVHDWPEIDPLAELENQIAQIAALDLVVQTSNTSAHIAGALGIETWVLQAFSPYWAWFLDRSDMPWYRNVRQFRMTTSGDWDGTVARTAEALTAWRGKFGGRTA